MMELTAQRAILHCGRTTQRLAVRRTDCSSAASSQDVLLALAQRLLALAQRLLAPAQRLLALAQRLLALLFRAKS